MAPLESMPSLCVLSLNGNPLCATPRMSPYRKRVVAAMPLLTCLDGLPVDDAERRCAAARMAGGREAELRERAAIREELRERSRREGAALRRTLAEGRARRAAREAADALLAADGAGAGGLLERVVVGEAEEAALRGEGAECTVCQQEFVRGAQASRLLCGHLYHLPCILRRDDR
jgi:hypothetical protein